MPQELHQWLHAAFAKRQVSDYEFIATTTGADAVDM